MKCRSKPQELSRDVLNSEERAFIDVISLVLSTPRANLSLRVLVRLMSSNARSISSGRQGRAGLSLPPSLHILMQAVSS